MKGIDLIFILRSKAFLYFEYLLVDQLRAWQIIYLQLFLAVEKGS